MANPNNGQIPQLRQGDLYYYNDIVINEILFNPMKGGVDFVEILNRSHRTINLQHWKLGSHLISDDVLLLEPGQHLALTANPTILYRQYESKEIQHMHAVSRLPAYPNEQGIVILSSPQGQMDSLYYNASMHQPFLRDTKGISLERQSPDDPTNDINNFLSASTRSGGATPGYQNSVQKSGVLKKNKLFLTSKTVSPNQDGFEDALEINYEFVGPSYMINISIFSENGQLVNRLVQQQSAGSSGKVVWDCRTEANNVASPGIYIFLAEIYNEKGSREVHKEGFVITGLTPSVGK